jgi:hypothetical protein
MEPPNRKVLEESCKENGAAVADLVTNHVVKVYGGANRKVLKESSKKMLLILLTNCYRPLGIL